MSDILEKFQQLYENQDMLSKLTNNEIYSSIGYSETHCLVVINDLNKPNLTQISKKMNMTLSAISKISKKLQQKKLIEVIKKDNNKKERFLILTDKGKTIYNEHKIVHAEWKRRDTEFLMTIKDNDKKIIDSFLDSFNKYLEILIKEKSNDNKYNNQSK